MLEHVQDNLREGGVNLRVSPFCRNLMAYCSSHRFTSELCRSRFNLGAKGSGTKWVTVLAPCVAFRSSELAGNQTIKEM